MRIVIVEDETRIRDGMAKLVERISDSYHVVGCAANGLLGLNCVKERYPDVVITDVRMPEMDGLEMIGALTAAGVRTRYIILSAYSEFEYAKKAMSFGVSDYLLKPISMAELAQSLKKLELQIQESVSREVDSLEAALRCLVLPDGTRDEKSQEGIAARFGLGRQDVFAQVLFYYGARNYPVARDSINRLTCRRLQAECAAVCPMLLENHHAILYLLTGVEDPQRFSAWLTSSVRIHAQTLWKGADISLAFATGWHTLHQTAMGLLDALPWKIALPGEPLLHWPQVLQSPTEPCAFPIEIENRLRVAVCSRSAGRIERQFEEFRRYFDGHTIYDPREIRESYTRFLWTALNLAKEVDLVKTGQIEARRLMESILEARNLTELNEVADQLLAVLTVAAGQTDTPDQNITILRAKSLIHEFYSTGITLEEIAQKLNLTPEYLSGQFHKDTGETFSAYMRKYRIGKAKELLIGTQLKLNQVAEQVGYADPKYFSQVFKKCTGQLPAEYRRANK